MLQDHSRNRTPMPAAQPPAGAAPPEPGPARAEAGIAQMLTSASSGASAVHSSVSDDLRAALDELAAADAAGWAETNDDDGAFDVHAARQDAADDAVLATPCRSLADVGAKLTCLIPRIRPDLLNQRHAEHLEAMHLDIDRLLAPVQAGAPPQVDPILDTIARHRKARAAYDSFALELEYRPVTWKERLEEDRLSDAEFDARDAVFRTVPSTPSGRAALIQFVRDQIAKASLPDRSPPDNGCPIWRDGLQALLAMHEGWLLDVASAANSDARRGGLAPDASRELIAIVEEWQLLLDQINGGGLSDAAVEQLGVRHDELQREVYNFPASSIADLLAKVPVFRDELYDATGSLDGDCKVEDTFSGAAWLGLFRDFERLARVAPAAASSASPILTAAPADSSMAASDEPASIEFMAGQEFEALRGGETAFSAWNKLAGQNALAMGLVDRLLGMSKAEMVSDLRAIEVAGEVDPETILRALDAAQKTFEGWSQLLELVVMRFLVAGSTIAMDDQAKGEA